MAVKRVRRGVSRTAMVVLLMLPATGAAAQTTGALPVNDQTTTFTAAVSEQARITVPAGVTFSVSNIAASNSQDIAIAVQNIVLTTASRQLRISVKADSAAFTPPQSGATTWAATAVSWTSGPGGGPNAWQNATGSAGTLSSASFNTVATCNPDVASCSIAKLPLTLGSATGVSRSGSYSLTVTWKFEAIGS